MAQLQIVQNVNRSMECSSCGAAGIAACDCGAPYMPASARAAEAVVANPRKSNRAIAADLGVAEGTVRTARKSTAQDYAVDTRVGLDGKVRKMPQRKTKPEEVIPTEEEAEESYQQHLYKMFLDYLDDMTEPTRRKLFAHIRRKYRDEL
jgi:hypothetical protein